jgi:hypothetical protein
VQTFLPYPDFVDTAEVLDYRRLGKQRVEARQILATLQGTSKRKGWIHHPAVRMWRGYEDALIVYSNVMIRVWIQRGYNNTMEILPPAGLPELPPWFGDETFHASHRSNLLRKDPEYYGQFGWTEGPDLPYVWPEER